MTLNFSVNFLKKNEKKDKMIFEDLFGFLPNWRTRVLVFYFPGLKGGGTFTFVFGPIFCIGTDVPGEPKPVPPKIVKDLSPTHSFFNPKFTGFIKPRQQCGICLPCTQHLALGGEVIS